MEGRTVRRQTAWEANFFGHQLCPHCGYALVAPEASLHVSEHTIKHIWSCEGCETKFATLIKLRRLEADESVVAA